MKQKMERMIQVQMSKTTRWLLLAVLALFVGCQDADDYTGNLTPEQRALLGTAVNFSTSIAEPFTTRTSYNASGAFNENDLITIYRQYAKSDGSFDEANEGYRVYSYQPKTVSGMSVALNTEWKVTPGKMGYETSRGLFKQTEADSLTWDEGTTVRFRAWGMSNLSGCLGGSWDSFYPDFTMSGWVSASGPSGDIPLSLKHLACRIAISPLGGNQITKVEICTDYKDYMREDNADSSEDDEKDKSTEDEAKRKAAAVLAVYNKMCMPGGVSFDTGLKAMSQAYKDTAKNAANLEKAEVQKKMIELGSLSADELKTKAVHPEFHSNNNNMYLLTIPHDMSSENQGERLVLPSYTRFRVYLRDVNCGDKTDNGDNEGTYHIFALNDIMKTNTDGTKTQMFSDGMQLIAGYSYKFTVGYKYNTLTVDMDNSLSWEEQNLEAGTITEDSQTLSGEGYTWWKNAINTAISNVMTNKVNRYDPEFDIKNVGEFVDFVNLLNGTAATQHTSEYTLERGKMTIDSTSTDKVFNRSWTWYKVQNGEKTVITKEEAEKDGWVFYNVYHNGDGDNVAYYEEQVLSVPYSFYSGLVNRKFKVTLSADLDLKDVEFAKAIGYDDATSFQGKFDGQGHTISNIYMKGGYFFGHVGQVRDGDQTNGAGAIIANLTLKSDHPLTVVENGNEVRLLGIRLQAPNYTYAFADKLSGASYLAGCANEGEGTNGLVGEASDLYMYGCMQTASGITGGAFLNKYSGSNNFFAPMTGTLGWGRFFCNYYDKSHSPNAKAACTDEYTSYQRQQYIRGVKTSVLCAKNDQLIKDQETLAAVKGNTERFEGFYGLAPWKAMNYAIYMYNYYNSGTYPCSMHYVTDDTNSTGFNYRYPVLKYKAPSAEDGTLNTTSWNVLDLLN